jgi:hypothetical protein
MVTLDTFWWFYMAAILLQLLTVLSLYIWFMRKDCLSLETKLASITRKRTACCLAAEGLREAQAENGRRRRK